MKPTNSIFIILLFFLLIPVNGYSEFCGGRTIMGFCYVKDTGLPLIGVEVTVENQTTGATAAGITADNWVSYPDGTYRITFACRMDEYWPWNNKQALYTVSSEATFDDGDQEYTLLTEQYTNVPVYCAQVATCIDFEYEPLTAVLLSSFSAVPSHRKVILQWETSDETDNFGFNVYRYNKHMRLDKVNKSVIYARGGEGVGATYELIDSDVLNRTEYLYALESIDVNGSATMHDAVSVTPRLRYLFSK
ncbi:MAG: hypothetical protein GY868_17965 [Deltaproteobacteria bacterium]|nr:hypothetical protein [Deltaproteobacteria bacterium]